MCSGSQHDLQILWRKQCAIQKMWQGKCLPILNTALDHISILSWIIKVTLMLHELLFKDYSLALSINLLLVHLDLLKNIRQFVLDFHPKCTRKHNLHGKKMFLCFRPAYIWPPHKWLSPKSNTWIFHPKNKCTKVWAHYCQDSKMGWAPCFLLAVVSLIIILKWSITITKRLNVKLTHLV